MPIIQADHRTPWFAGASLRIDEEGARWSLFRKLGRIGERGAFEEAVAWTLENQPEPDEAKGPTFGDLGSSAHGWRCLRRVGVGAYCATQLRADLTG